LRHWSDYLRPLGEGLKLDARIWRKQHHEHESAPLFKERDAYLRHRLAEGMKRERVRSLGGTLLHVVRLLSLYELRRIGAAELESAGEAWAVDSAHHSYKRAGEHSKQVFITAARAFLRFHSALVETPATIPFQAELDHYLAALATEKGLAANTIYAHRGHVAAFLVWIAGRHGELSQATISDVRDYVSQKLKSCKMTSVYTAAQPLKSFFAFGEVSGFCSAHLGAVLSFSNRSRAQPAKHPNWREVRTLLDNLDRTTASGLRNHAILSLCAVYGLRASEVSRLRLSDLDWTEGTMTVRRSKTGAPQQYPLQAETAESIRDYLQSSRPECLCPTLFVTLNRPFRTVNPIGLSMVARRAMSEAGLVTAKKGTHSLRHAAATELLRTGTPLKDIADFLGHKGLKTVSTYVRCDEVALQEVAAFSLGQFL